jgi:two-component system nitrogen regulation response regulator GlnG
MPSLLVVDDDPQVLRSVQSSLECDDLEVLSACTAKQGIELVRQEQPAAVILDVRLPDLSGLDAVDCIRQIDPRLPVIVVTAYAKTETAIEAMKRGAFDYLIKPVNLHQLREIVAKAIELSRMRHVPAVFDDQEEHGGPVERIVGRCPAMQDIYKAIGRVAPLDVNVLLLGESGVGKELAARAIYHHSRRSQSPFLTINCPAIPETLLEGELFGYERGAFTGADHRRIGKFEQAHQGTLLLDEIGDMPLAIQAKLLRFLQDGRFDRLGGNETIYSDVRVIATTNQDLEELARSGRFRQDLFYRLNVYTIHLPPLRTRMDDLQILVDHFLQRFNREFGKQVRSCAPDTMQLLSSHEWPGNVRELQNTIRFALIQASSDQLTPGNLPENLRSVRRTRASHRPGADLNELNITQFVESLLRSGQPDIYRQVCTAVDRVVFEVVLHHVHGNQLQASGLLGIARNTLRAKLLALGIAAAKPLGSDPCNDSSA